MKPNYNTTIFACFVGYIVQAIVNNFVPLLFITFQHDYQIPLTQITLLVTINFGVQLTVDLLSTLFVDKIGYRTSIVIAQIFSASGLLMLTFMPEIMDPFTGILLSVIVYAIGGGIIEVVNGPIVEACPTENKEGTMSLLHSFYCWGHVGVVILSTVFFWLFGIENWKILACLWALVPLVNGISFLHVPIAHIVPEGERGLTVRQLLKKPVFWIFFLMMLCSGASEQGMSQWASAFAEQALQIPKAVGDLAGPLSFALCMGLARAGYAKFSEKMDLEKFMMGSAALCIAAYLITCLAPNPLLSFLGCALGGFSVGIMWPGTFSLGVAGIRNGGTVMAAFFAVAGDVGCSLGPTLVGIASDALGGDLKKGMLSAIVFPVTLLLAVVAKRTNTRKQ
jgi:fucose permease